MKRLFQSIFIFQIFILVTLLTCLYAVTIISNVGKYGTSPNWAEIEAGFSTHHFDFPPNSLADWIEVTDCIDGFPDSVITIVYTVIHGEKIITDVDCEE